MHTSQTTHHRIFFTDVTKPDYLEGLCKDLGFEKIDDTTYDLALEEGSQLTVEDACRVAVSVAALGNPAGDPEDLLFMLGCIARLLAERGYVPHSTTFEADVDLETLSGVDISCLELFDLLSALSYGYKVKGIYTQWAMVSNKAEFGANAGGTRITMRSFSIPCQVYPDRAESLIDLLAKHKDNEIGDVFAMEFILPLLEKPMILTKEMELSIQASLHRFFGGLPHAGMEDIIPPHLASIDRQLQQLGGRDKPDPLAREYTPEIAPALIAQTLASMQRQGINPNDIQIKGVNLRNSRVPQQPPTLDTFRNFKPVQGAGVSDDVQFYLAWYGFSLMDFNNGHGPEIPDCSAVTDAVAEIREKLAQGDILDIPAIAKYQQELEKERQGGFDQDVFEPGSLIQPQAQKPSEEQVHIPADQNHGRMLNQTGFEKDAVPLDREIIRDMHVQAGAMARSSQQVEHTYGGVPMEKTGVDYSEVSTGRSSFSGTDNSPSPVNDSSSNDTSSSSPSD